jgi:hypothetical protein
MMEEKKNLEIAMYLKERWHKSIEETPKKDRAQCIVQIGVDEEGNGSYDLFTWDESKKGFDTGIGRFTNKELRGKHVWLYPESIPQWCYLEDLTPETREIGECTVEESKKLAKRFWLRKKLYDEYGASYKEEMQNAFEWIYNAPLKDWENMLESLKLSYGHGIHETKGLQLKKAKELFAFLS